MVQSGAFEDHETATTAFGSALLKKHLHTTPETQRRPSVKAFSLRSLLGRCVGFLPG